MTTIDPEPPVSNRSTGPEDGDHVAVPSDLSLEYMERTYAAFLSDPASVPEGWRAWCLAWARGDRFAARPQLGPGVRNLATGVSGGTELRSPAALQNKVDQLVRAYRVRGHLRAQLDPLEMTPQPEVPEMEPDFYGLGAADLDREFVLETLPGRKTRPLREIISHLTNTYCRRIGVQFMHMDDLAVRSWLQTRMEGSENRLVLSREQQLRILTRLTDASLFEEFIQKKFVGAKSFSLEGSESLIPLLDLAVEVAARHGVRRAVLGMAHRGRLNVLANVMGKSPRLIFREFEDPDTQDSLARGDVKYHLGFNSTWTTAAGTPVELYLCFNPSHLEYVGPVALGRLRAKMDRAGDQERGAGLAILIHGDAAFSGEGIVQETLNLSELAGYQVGGALHVIVNNQIGFTTAPRQARSTSYASDVAKMLQSPIFHVNGEDPEAVAQVISLAMEFRRAFRRDVVVDMYAYRRRGHNEGDEPTFTQPVMYRAIEARRSVRESYLEYLLQLGQVTRHEAEQIAARRRDYLEQELSQARSDEPQLGHDAGTVWKEFQGGEEAGVAEVETGITLDEVTRLGGALCQLPERFTPHPKIDRLLQQRAEMANGGRPIDWAMAEALAFGSLLADGRRVRITGQDVERGTFGHRHAVLHDHHDDRRWCPLETLARGQGQFEIHNSPLSEAGVLGFEYGYSLDAPEALVIWEAQFGDFSNCAQVIIDQFICSGEEKWRRLSGVVLLLPHGFEGQGPEHSSARLERFLWLSASDNIQIAQPTTPAQLFHLLRRQLVRRWRKPLVVMTPKSLLRHPRAVSRREQLSTGTFQRILPDNASQRDPVRLVLLCSGKIAYDLEQHRETHPVGAVAIHRVEQLYPLPDATLRAALAQYPVSAPVRWVQEEPANMGAWPYLRLRFGDLLPGGWAFDGVTRRAAASPATGSAAAHRQEQAQLIAEAFR